MWMVMTFPICYVRANMKSIFPTVFSFRAERSYYLCSKAYSGKPGEEPSTPVENTWKQHL
ncbi:hypothetical protein SERLA73DRAFT_182209 [Serpula lacrymans var. lacrymans S7.3]|uniref:Uncharacterized protein n=2 Tax=Serpula lacrymans var. lacrymans TaxID=341189 RepID=F8PWV0_SERL3|nr:uncharacterized protein SERLADRAFT_468752 [Serpula lacrymans var. lacrymans S7.9]EGN99277.1 hypothetical protein SERLA73DRAFT_182209 [Serpula lacrymans var. lacrymans S7.3]EGO24842.1 hypothetical protein SERLADRAFT_468752 [Serpula lacrymans var. lacrymans S7.9]